MNKICGIYKITSPSGKIYIGQSNNIFRRKWEYASKKCCDQPKLYNSIIKYGWENHNFEIIYECNENELNYYERYYINYYSSFNSKHELNLTEGGDHYKLSKETKQKISKSRKGIVYDKSVIEKTKQTKRNKTYESRAGNYEIYNDNNELQYKFQGNFRKKLKQLKMPYKSFNQSQKYNRKIKKGNYIGWYAKKLNINSIT